MSKLPHSTPQKRDPKSKTTGRAVVDDSKIAESFSRVESSLAETLVLLGRGFQKKQLIEKLRYNCSIVATDLNSLIHAKARTTEPLAAAAISEEDFIAEVRKFTWDCLTVLTDTSSMEAGARLRHLRRRLTNRARSFETLAKAEVVDRAALVAWIARAESVASPREAFDDED